MVSWHAVRELAVVRPAHRAPEGGRVDRRFSEATINAAYLRKGPQSSQARTQIVSGWALGCRDGPAPTKSVMESSSI